MTRHSSMVLIVLLTVGCARTGSQTPVQSAHDDVGFSEGSGDGDDDALYEENVIEDGLAASSFGHETSSSDGEDEVVAVADGTPSEIDDETWSAVDDLVGASWQNDQSRRVYEAVTELGGFDDRAVVPLAHFSRGDRHAVIAWPAVTTTGDLAGTAVYGVCVEELSDGTFELCGDRWLVNEVTSAMARLEGALGGSDYEVVSDQSTSSLDDLGERVAGLGNAFVNAASLRDREALFRTAQEFLLMLPVHDLAFNNILPQTLVTSARSQKSFSHMKTEIGDSLASITCTIDGEMYEVTILNLTAEHDGSGLSAWRIVDYW